MECHSIIEDLSIPVTIVNLVPPHLLPSSRMFQHFFLVVQITSDKSDGSIFTEEEEEVEGHYGQSLGKRTFTSEGSRIMFLVMVYYR